MFFQGVRLSLLIGPTVAIPAPPNLIQSLDSIEITQTDAERSGFQLSFKIDRSGLFAAIDYPILKLPLLRPFNRVIIVVTVNATPHVLMDGIITHQQLSPSSNNSGLLTVTGEDVSVMMDMEEKIVEHPAQPDIAIVPKIIATYAQYGLIPTVVPPPSIDVPNPVERVPVQVGTDLEYLEELAERYAYVFYVSPGPVPGTNTAYWGPPTRADVPQRALSVNLGTSTNVYSINIQHKALTPTFVSGQGEDSLTGRNLPIKTFSSLRLPLATQSAMLKTAKARKVLPKQGPGLTYAQMLSRAQVITDTSMDQVVEATGELDVMRYNGVLKARGVVGLRGVGSTYDGLYYVKSVTHQLRLGEYKQSFTLTREGVGTTTPVVIP
ncbi:hypothetical protein [Leptolyngbya sp. FACHB-16]|uniref:hypothetical protein n=1 Tax=unclassified Leptolyngbya TaxID=2650499 RepID=UPI0016888310|nr:hypothetical protein [Leptolyngbya sp. FACHB-16]MBD2158534.1 hypothetical protein [Leptolyngbya sp. FACHB-16]